MFLFVIYFSMLSIFMVIYFCIIKEMGNLFWI